MHPLPSETRVVGRSVRVSEDKLRDWIPAEKVERTYTFGELRETFDNDGDGSLVIILLNEVERLQAALYVDQHDKTCFSARDMPRGMWICTCAPRINGSPGGHMTTPHPTSNLGTIRSNLERALQLCHVDGVIYPHILAAWKALESMSTEAQPTSTVDLVVYQPTTCGDLAPIEFEYEKQDADACVLYSDYLKAVARLEKSSGETPVDCKDHVAARCPTCIATWARAAGTATTASLPPECPGCGCRVGHMDGCSELLFGRTPTTSAPVFFRDHCDSQAVSREAAKELMQLIMKCDNGREFELIQDWFAKQCALTTADEDDGNCQSCDGNQCTAGPHCVAMGLDDFPSPMEVIELDADMRTPVTTTAIPVTDDFALLLRLMHVLVAFEHWPGNKPNSARLDPLYPGIGLRANARPLIDQIHALLAKYPYGTSPTCAGSKAPNGWYCTRAGDHEGPCAAVMFHWPGRIDSPTETRRGEERRGEQHGAE